MQRIITKAAAEIRPGDDDEASPSGTFDVILSAQSLDRDGDELKSTEWQQPLPDHITFDVDHGMNVASTVGSGKPFINEDGNLQVRGAYSSIARAQEVRTLVNEGHIRTTSVAFLTHKNKKGVGVERELLNGAFVAIPANPDAVVLASKSLVTAKTADLTDDELKIALEERGYTVSQAEEPEVTTEPIADEESADTADAAAEEAAAEQKSADDVALRARALQITFQSLGL